jgi:hypothetical protein
MFSPQQAIIYDDMCAVEGTRLQKGMNYRIAATYSVLLMSVRKGARYKDSPTEDGRTIVYEGHDVSRSESSNPKKVDQPLVTPGGKPTENAKFFEAATLAKSGGAKPEHVRIYDKVRKGLWVYNGLYDLVDAWAENVRDRKVFKFKLVLAEDQELPDTAELSLTDMRFIPSSVKAAVWKRDGGKCVMCGAKDNLHFDHEFPFSKGGTSHLAANIRILCARHNLEKGAKLV